MIPRRRSNLFGQRRLLTALRTSCCCFAAGVALGGEVNRAQRQQGSNQSSTRIQTHHSRATGTIAIASTARL